jgi:hypothetical protein
VVMQACKHDNPSRANRFAQQALSAPAKQELSGGGKYDLCAGQFYLLRFVRDVQATSGGVGAAMHDRPSMPGGCGVLLLITTCRRWAIPSRLSTGLALHIAGSMTRATS